jgi:hypothetical protein
MTVRQHVGGVAVLGLHADDEGRPGERIDAEEEHHQGQDLTHAPTTGRLDVVAEEADADDDRGQGVDDDQGRLRGGDGPGPEGVLGEEQPGQTRGRPARRGASGEDAGPPVADLVRSSPS